MSGTPQSATPTGLSVSGMYVCLYILNLQLQTLGPCLFFGR
jgi:hypothetical protein